MHSNAAAPLALASLVGGLALGCDAPPADPTATARSSASSAPVFQSFPPADDLCSTRRMVVYDQTGACPTRPGWALTRVFPGAWEPELLRYCRYEYLGSGLPTVPEIAALPGLAKKPDCLVAHPAASDLSQARWTAFRIQIDPPSLATVSGHPPAPVWLAMVDTSPPGTDGAAAAGGNPHGYLLARIARETGCPDGAVGPRPCLVHVHHELALPWRFDGSQWFRPSDGGDFGYQTDVAAAVVRAVRAFEASGAGRLVVNLSLGWLDAYGGDAVTLAGHAPVRSVLAAIDRARCASALVLAAAGNRSGGTRHTDGPLYPAGWATRPAPDAARCVALGGTAPFFPERVGVLEAVAGVDGADVALANARPNSTPRLVAPGYMGSATRATGGIEPGFLTGSSVSTAVAATAAAVAWAYVPDQTATEVARAVYEGGAPTGATEDPTMCRGPCQPVRRVSVCGAIQSACVHPSGGLRPGCVPQSCLRRPAFADARPQLQESHFPTPTRWIDAPPLQPYGPSGVPPQCGATTLYRPAGLTTPAPFPCVERQAYGGAAHPDVDPQPGTVGCPACGYGLTASELIVRLDFDPTAVSMPLHAPSLEIRTTAGVLRYTLFEIAGVDPLEGGKSYRIARLFKPAGAVMQVSLHGRTDIGEAWSTQLVRFEAK